MKIKDFVSVLDQRQFIAVGLESEKRISYSGSAGRFKSFLEDRKVARVIVPKTESEALIIYAE